VLHNAIRGLALAGCLAASIASAQPAPHAGHDPAPAPAVAAPAAGLELVGPSAAARLTAAEFAALPHQSVSVIWHGRPATYEGVLLGDLLQRVGAPRGEAVRGPALASVIIVTADDGYRVVLGLADTERSINVNRIVVADRQAGQPLAGEDGAFRLVVEGDLKPARSARQVRRIEWRRLD
jgi:hypothetical protein